MIELFQLYINDEPLMSLNEVLHWLEILQDHFPNDNIEIYDNIEIWDLMNEMPYLEAY